MLLAAPAAGASAASSIRFVHAVPGADAATLRAGDGTELTAGFGVVSSYAEVPSGSTRLTVSSDGDRRARISEQLEDGARYTVIALARGDGVALRAYRDGRPEAGIAKLRTISAAPELGKVDVTVGGIEVGGDLGHRSATRYRTLEPGTYNFEVTKAGGGDPLVSRPGLVVTAGAATTAIVVGSRGERLRVISATDGTATPPGAPATGLGGLAGEGTPRWVILLLGSLAAAALGAAVYLAQGARRRAPREP